MCGTCRVLQEEISRRRFNSLLSRVSLSRATCEQTFEAIKQLNKAELELKMAEDSLKWHQVEHLEKMIQPDA